MKTLLMLILLGIVAPVISSTNGTIYKCYECEANFTAGPNDPCWNSNPPTERIKECEAEGRCTTKVYWKEKYGEQRFEILRGCSYATWPAACSWSEWSVATYCECEDNLCNNEPADQIPKNRGGNRFANGTIVGGDDSGDKALGVLVGPSFGTLVMGLLLGVGGALLPLLLQ